MEPEVSERMGEPGSEEEKLRVLRAEVWERTKEVTMARVTALEGTLGEMEDGQLSGEKRAEAGGEAHKLSGSLGTFGFLEAGRLAGEIEAIFKRGGELNAEARKRVEQLLVSLRKEIEAGQRKLEKGSSGM